MTTSSTNSSEPNISGHISDHISGQNKPASNSLAQANQVAYSQTPNPVAKMQPLISEYTDYRKYLKDTYEYRRRNESTGMRSYSYSHFSAAADIKSPNYLKLIIEGKRNLSDDMITRFARALRLEKQQAEEFKSLVLYGQADEPVERNKYLKDLAEIRADQESDSDANKEKWEKVPGWIGWVLYAIMDQKNAGFEPEQLQKLFRAKANVQEVRESLQKLIASGELVQDPETGELKRPKELVDTPQDLPVALIRRLQTELIYLGIESLFRDSPKDREFGALTLALTQEEFEQVRFELRQLRKRIHKDISTKRQTTKGDRVYQLNIQLFPVTEKS